MSLSATDQRMIARMTYLNYTPLIAQSEQTIIRLSADIMALTDIGGVIDVAALQHLTDSLAAENTRLLRYQCAECEAMDAIDGTYWR